MSFVLTRQCSASTQIHCRSFNEVRLRVNFYGKFTGYNIAWRKLRESLSVRAPSVSLSRSSIESRKRHFPEGQIPENAEGRCMLFILEKSPIRDEFIQRWRVKEQLVPVNTRVYDKSQWKANYVFEASRSYQRALMGSSEWYSKLHYLRCCFWFVQR